MIHWRVLVVDGAIGPQEHEEVLVRNLGMAGFELLSRTDGSSRREWMG